ncbi:CLUMA_CG015533, isoform A [Clunio marinus]|uniref:CLUMA_CG015533, isoform A n=1 Tax=Clunio marinus TaxID=568069 RepID=A0A1J1IPZ2_9DIPT|nr:CLUMA_CG015533, isoform A [Clunio marinus]
MNYLNTNNFIFVFRSHFEAGSQSRYELGKTNKLMKYLIKMSQIRFVALPNKHQNIISKISGLFTTLNIPILVIV